MWSQITLNRHKISVSDVHETFSMPENSGKQAFLLKNEQFSKLAREFSCSFPVQIPSLQQEPDTSRKLFLREKLFWSEGSDFIEANQKQTCFSHRIVPQTLPAALASRSVLRCKLLKQIPALLIRLHSCHTAWLKLLRVTDTSQRLHWKLKRPTQAPNIQILQQIKVGSWMSRVINLHNT